MQTISANGAAIPVVGLGTFALRGRDGARAIADAIAAGYRHIDTAQSYGNEDAVGDGIRASGVPRGQIFVTTKIPAESLTGGALERSLEGSLTRLRFDYVDLALIHWPNARVPAAVAMKSLNDAKRRGLTRHIGVSNYTVALLEAAWAATEEPLVANQCEYHPYLNQDRVLACCRKHGMAFTAYCPLGRSMVFDEPAIVTLAKRKGRTPAQIVLRWEVQQGVVPIPKSGNPDRIRENLDIFGFSLDEAEMASVSALTKTRHHRICDFGSSPKWDS